MCVLCMQTIAECRKNLRNPSLSEEDREMWKEYVLESISSIHKKKAEVASYEEAIQAKQLELSILKG